MTQDEIIEMARQAGFFQHLYSMDVELYYDETMLGYFAILVAAKYKQKIQDLEDMVAELQERQE